MIAPKELRQGGRNLEGHREWLLEKSEILVGDHQGLSDYELKTAIRRSRILRFSRIEVELRDRPHSWKTPRG